MKFRIAKKIMDGRSTLWAKWKAKRPMYYDKERDMWCQPSLHDIGQLHKAMHVYLHHYARGKKKFE